MTTIQQEKFGTIKGVWIPNVTMMFGVILFLRLGVLSAHSGAVQMLAVIGLSLTIMVFTSFSIGSLATNMQVGKGGVYYIISRTLGIEIGGAVGLGLYLAQLITIALTVAGFSVSLVEIYPSLSLQVVEIVTLTLLSLLSGYSASWTLRLQGVILLVLLAAIGSVLLGSPENLNNTGITGKPFYFEGSLSFWQTFAMFYPALTGIEAGMALSGSLKTPGKSLYKGNLYALLFVAFWYACLGMFALWKIPHEILVSDPFAFVDFARWPFLVYLGIWGATLSSAMGCLLGSPRMLQSMAEDGIINERLGKSYGKKQEPRAALGVTYLLAAFTLLVATIDQIIPILTMICLASYGLLNLVTFISELMNSPSWRPRLRTHWLTSLAAVGLVIIAMFMTAPGWAFATFAILTFGYFVIQSRGLETGFQDLRESVLFFISRLSLYRLQEPTEYALTWHPQLLVLVTTPPQQEKLVFFSHSVTRRSGILTFAVVVPEEWQSYERIQSARASLLSQFEQRKIACMAEVYPAPNSIDGYVQLIRAYGIGPIQPNTVVMELDENEVGPGLVDVIEACCCTQKNLVLVQDSKKCSDTFFMTKIGARQKRIDVWWDPDETTNFDLTLSFVTTLTDGFIFGGANVAIKAHVSDENAEEPVRDYLKSYCEKSRLKGKIVVSHKPIHTSKPVYLSFVSMRPLNAEATEEQKQQYLEYLKELFDSSPKDSVVMFVTSYDHVDHRAIYLPNT